MTIPHFFVRVPTFLTLVDKDKLLGKPHWHRTQMHLRCPDCSQATRKDLLHQVSSMIPNGFRRCYSFQLSVFCGNCRQITCCLFCYRVLIPFSWRSIHQKYLLFCPVIVCNDGRQIELVAITWTPQCLLPSWFAKYSLVRNHINYEVQRELPFSSAFIPSDCFWNQLLVEFTMKTISDLSWSDLKLQFFDRFSLFQTNNIAFFH